MFLGLKFCSLRLFVLHSRCSREFPPPPNARQDLQTVCCSTTTLDSGTYPMASPAIVNQTRPVRGCLRARRDKRSFHLFPSAPPLCTCVVPKDPQFRPTLGRLRRHVPFPQEQPSTLETQAPRQLWSRATAKTAKKLQFQHFVMYFGALD